VSTKGTYSTILGTTTEITNIHLWQPVKRNCLCLLFNQNAPLLAIMQYH